MDTLNLAPDLEDFAREAVASGRYRTVADVLGTAMNLLRRAEAERDAFIASLEAAQDEGRRDGFFTVEQIAAELDAIIEDTAPHTS